MRRNRRQRRQEVRRVRLDPFRACRVDAARQHVGVRNRKLLPGDNRQIATLGELHQLGIELLNLGRQ